jgi:hypothetical protein
MYSLSRSARNKRKTRLKFETNQELRYRGKLRPLVVHAQPWLCEVRLKGTRLRFEISWESIYTHAAQLAADRMRAERKAKRSARK